ncbi:MAG: DUF1127 domain-containing protein [Alphaproteobacteria bacterium]|jgi:uncharacterized protein YjiS (DUF1127 family)|nr:DUF1127 domain-containing protein [Alphaproteobacteria bacterium]
MTDTTYTASLSGQPAETVSQAFRTLARLVMIETLSWPGRVLQTLVVWQKRFELRIHLAGLDAHLRHDVGLTQADIAAETKKPFWTA